MLPRVRPEEMTAVTGESPIDEPGIQRPSWTTPAETIGDHVLDMRLTASTLSLAGAAHQLVGEIAPHPSGNPGSLRRPAFTNGVVTRGSK
ncbi:hypothetical protein GCM10020001_034830 [Nonomuraea salmonea]